MLGEIFSDEIAVLQEEIRIKEAQISSLQGVELSVIDAMTALSSAIATATEIAPLAIKKLKKSVMSLWDNDPNDRAPDDGNQDSNSHPENSGNSSQDSNSHPENSGNSNQDSNSHPENSGNSNQDSFLTEKQANLTYCGDNRIGQMYSSDGEIQFSYLRGNNKAKLESWGRYLIREKYAAGFQLRAPNCVTTCKHEIKIWGLKNIQILYLINLNKQPPSPDFAEINPSTLTFPKQYEVRRNTKAVFATSDYQEALDFYKSEIKNPITVTATLLDPEYRVLEQFHVGVITNTNRVILLPEKSA
jgi:DNA mismatch repair ATPase MutL